MSNKVELNEKEMANVLGGLDYDPNTQTIGYNNSTLEYHYDDFDKVYNYVVAHLNETYATGRDRDTAWINGMLSEGIIY